MVGKTERDCGFVGHREFLSQLAEFGVPIVPVVPEVPIGSEACGTLKRLELLEPLAYLASMNNSRWRFQWLGIFFHIENIR
jgi:hypothetical protein